MSILEEHDENGRVKKIIKVNFATTNARSIAPKIISLVENFNELELCLFAITETWLGNSREVNHNIRDLVNSSNIDMLHKNRKTRGGGVALAYNNTLAKFSQVSLRNNSFELLCCKGKINSLARPLIVFVVYLPPKMSADSLRAFCTTLADGIELVKSNYDDPFILITGDFNKKSISPALCDFPDIVLVDPVPTRGTACLDLSFSNLGPHITTVRSLPPLESNDNNTVSDHNIVSMSCKFPMHAHFTKKKITFRPFTTRGEAQFGREILSYDWSLIHDNCPNISAENLRVVLDSMINKCFPTKTRTIKSTDSPWLTREVALLSRRKKREYALNRRSRRWKMLDKICKEKSKQAKVDFFEGVKVEVKSSGNSAGFFKAVKRLSQGDGKNNDWSVNDMFPNESDEAIAEKVAVFFNRISSEYEPLHPLTTPVDAPNSICPALHEISGRLKSIKKPKSMVAGDIFKQLVSKYADIIAIPLHHVYTRAFSTGTWPDLWKRETVVVIPKVTKPENLGELRNLSCTPLFSKVMESFILERLKTEVRLSDS